MAIFRGQDSATVFAIYFGPGWVGVAPRLDKGEENLIWDLSPELQSQLRQVFDIGT
jgi:hypothetical protein